MREAYTSSPPSEKAKSRLDALRGSDRCLWMRSGWLLWQTFAMSFAELCQHDHMVVIDFQRRVDVLHDAFEHVASFLAQNHVGFDQRIDPSREPAVFGDYLVGRLAGFVHFTSPWFGQFSSDL